MGLFGPTLEKVEKWTAGGKVGKLLDALTSDDAVIRETAAQGLAQVGGPEVLAFCRENAHSDNDDLRWHITQVLGLMGTPEAIKILEGVMEPSEKIKRSIAKKKKS
jgi:HEAT repeat protein